MCAHCRRVEGIRNDSMLESMRSFVKSFVQGNARGDDVDDPDVKPRGTCFVFLWSSSRDIGEHTRDRSSALPVHAHKHETDDAGMLSYERCALCGCDKFTPNKSAFPCALCHASAAKACTSAAPRHRTSCPVDRARQR